MATPIVCTHCGYGEVVDTEIPELCPKCRRHVWKLVKALPPEPEFNANDRRVLRSLRIAAE